MSTKYTCLGFVLILGIVYSNLNPTIAQESTGEIPFGRVKRCDPFPRPVMDGETFRRLKDELAGMQPQIEDSMQKKYKSIELIKANQQFASGLFFVMKVRAEDEEGDKRIHHVYIDYKPQINVKAVSWIAPNKTVKDEMVAYGIIEDTDNDIVPGAWTHYGDWYYSGSYKTDLVNTFKKRIENLVGKEFVEMECFGKELTKFAGKSKRYLAVKMRAKEQANATDTTIHCLFKEQRKEQTLIDARIVKSDSDLAKEWTIGANNKP